MYRIIAVGHDQGRVIFATPERASDGLVYHRAALNVYPEVLIEDPCGLSINRSELARRAAAEGLSR